MGPSDRWHSHFLNDRSWMTQVFLKFDRSTQVFLKFDRSTWAFLKIDKIAPLGGPIGTRHHWEWTHTSLWLIDSEHRNDRHVLDHPGSTDKMINVITTVILGYKKISHSWHAWGHPWWQCTAEDPDRFRNCGILIYFFYKICSIGSKSLGFVDAGVLYEPYNTYDSHSDCFNRLLWERYHNKAGETMTSSGSFLWYLRVNTHTASCEARLGIDHTS